MASYYVRADGAAANKAAAIGPDTNPGACMSLATCNTESAGFSAGDIIYISAKGGEFSDRIIPLVSGLVGNPIQYIGIDKPIINGNGVHTLRISARNYIDFFGIIFNGVFSYLSNTTNININYCILKNGTNAFGNLYLDTNAAVRLNNCIVHSSSSYGLCANTAGCSIILRNSIVYGNLNSGIFTANGAAIDYDYNIITGNGPSLTLNMILGVGAIDGGHNILTAAPKIKKYKNNTAYFVFSIDDNYTTAPSTGSNGEQAKLYADALTSYNVKMTLFIRTDGGDGLGMSDTAKSNFLALHNQGHEIAVHTWSHSLMDRTQAFDITTTNANPTCNVDVSGHQIILATTTPGNSVTLDWTGGFGKTIQNLQTAVIGKGWTITPKANVQPTLLLSSLADSVGAQVVPYTTNLDKSAPNYKFFYDEITAPRDQLQVAIGVQPVTYAYPGNVPDAGAEAYLLSRRFIAGRANVDRTLSSLNIYRVATTAPNLFIGGGTEVEIRRLANHYYTWAKDSGYIIVFFIHSTDDISIVQTIWLIDELIKLGAEFSTFKSAVNKIKDDHTTTNNITYAKTYADISNYYLQRTSSAINAGVDVGLTSDLDGRAIIGTPSIGVYEYIPSINLGTRKNCKTYSANHRNSLNKMV